MQLFTLQFLLFHPVFMLIICKLQCDRATNCKTVWLVIFILQAQTSNAEDMLRQRRVRLFMFLFCVNQVMKSRCAALLKSWYTSEHDSVGYRSELWRPESDMKMIHLTKNFLFNNIELSWAAVEERKEALPFRSSQMILIHWHEWETDDRSQTRHVCSWKSTVWERHTVSTQKTRKQPW